MRHCVLCEKQWKRQCKEHLRPLEGLHGDYKENYCSNDTRMWELGTKWCDTQQVAIVPSVFLKGWSPYSRLEKDQCCPDQSRTQTDNDWFLEYSTTRPFDGMPLAAPRRQQVDHKHVCLLWFTLSPRELVLYIFAQI